MPLVLDLEIILCSEKGQSKIQAAKTSDHISSFQDVFPTICELAGIETTTPNDGISFLNVLMNKPNEEHPYLYWEFYGYGGQQAIRMGEWKALRRNILRKRLFRILSPVTAWTRRIDNLRRAH